MCDTTRTKEESILGNLNFQMDPNLSVQVTQDSGLAEDGCSLASFYPGKKPLEGTTFAKLKPCSPSEKQLLLGTLLGDGSMQWGSKLHGRIRFTHGQVQEAYCRQKAHILRSYVKTQPQIVENRGWGDKSCVFSTVLTPAFSFMHALAYRPDFTNPQKLVKTVTQEWLNLLTWEGIAWWYQDDGTLTQAGGVHISTHGFPQEQVELLANMLTQRGVAAKAQQVKKGEKIYFIIVIGSEATRKFIEKVKPFVHPSMSYKVDLQTQTFLTCHFCGAPFLKKGGPAPDTPACEDYTCLRKAGNQRNRKYVQRLGGNSALWAKKIKPRLEQNPELKAALTLKRKAAEEKRKQDPIYVEKWKAIRAQWKKDNAEKVKAQKAARMLDPNYVLQMKEKDRIRTQDPTRKARKLEMQKLRRSNTLPQLH
jgi:hypothetical protein